ncbi:SusF/SusE family outer membrane protein [Cytophagales bacterium LB-30]|uniref:SusF/SusE family outer membrane protein n=1 Tax=Shiella aurantiaca TaxID=3058365 RepID=A0ABT8F0Y4_9BACT|nr:SusF/SusE family outer membrane protein [Shiella aurantiaca]MDN4164107.1 SusF/SusE family outer membrane protein [Shiella aurantiaca]
MNKLVRIWGGILPLLFMAVMVSCEEDPVIEDAEGLPLANGFYLAKEGEDPIAAQQLVSELVEAEGFQTQEREGYSANYMFLSAGNYHVVNVQNREITQTIGGSSEDLEITGSDCERNTINVVAEAAVDGAAFSIPSDGLYKVIYDQELAEIVTYKIEVANVIGAASEAGWGHADAQNLTISGTPSADGVTFSATNIVLRPGEWKVRFNCRWTIDRRVDPLIGQNDASNGYVALTNFGGTFDNLVEGGANFAQADGSDGRYTVTATWTAEDGFVVTATQTEALDPISFDPSNFAWGIIGSATPTGWDSDTDLNYEGVAGGVYSWKGTFALVAGEFKFRTNDDWAFNIGFGTTLTGPDAGDLTDTGGNFTIAAAATYEFIISTADEGDSWSINVTKQ